MNDLVTAVIDVPDGGTPNVTLTETSTVTAVVTNATPTTAGVLSQVQLPTGVVSIDNDPLVTADIVETDELYWSENTTTGVDIYSSAFGNTKVAQLTTGAKTVEFFTTNRTFTQQKPPFTDLFDRTTASGWGATEGGGTWGNFNGTASNYNTNGVGTIHPSINLSHYVRINDIVKAFDVELIVSLTTAPTGATNSVSLMTGFQTTSNHNRFRLTFNTTKSLSANISEVVSGTETLLATAVTVAPAATYVANQKWHIRAVHDGAGNLSMYTWKDGDPTPTVPSVTAFSTTYLTGKLGVRVLTATGNTNDATYEFHSYAGSATYPTPPVVTHNVWVRTMSTPFAGTIDWDWIKAHVNDTTDDVLAQAMKYVYGGTTRSFYGPLYNIGRSWDVGHADDGTRQEGSDWNDYLGIDGSVRYTHLVPPQTDAAEAHQLGCLDCSGYVRTIYGVEQGLPLCLDVAGDYDGLNIPRRSVDQAASGPGYLVIPHSGSSAPASRANILPGDLVYFDADTTDPTEEEGQVDHSGIYLGVDTLGNERFISSRKTINGPMFSDTGGNSWLNGTSLYARSFRACRRF